MIQASRGSGHRLTIHGEPEACRDLADYARSELGLDAVLPEKHHKYEI